MAAYSTINGSEMTLSASVLDEEGGSFIETTRTGSVDRPRELGRAVAMELLDKGAAAIIERTRPE
ncbi:MAG: hypothetical protein MZV49_22575 [Rhodopseudomonas palustris]|nr:hypothetical protein [Rhodopseudomonas palustris]